LNHKKAPVKERSSEGVDIYRLPPAQIRFAGQFIRAFFILRLLLKLERQSPLDIVHLGHIYESGLGGLIFKLIKKKPLVTTLLGWETYDPITPLPSRWNRFLAWIMNKSDRVVAMSSHIAQAAREQGCRKDIEKIPHGTNMFELKATVSIREKHGISPDKKICLSIQRLHPRKGMSYLIDSIPSVLHARDNVVWIIGGIGPQEQVLKQKVDEIGISEHVIFAGFVPDEQLASYYEQSDLFVLPTLYEAFGLVYVDALAKGLPIVTTSVGGALDIVQEHVGILVEPADSHKLAEALVLALDKQWDRQKIREYAGQYDWNRIVERYLDIYESLVRE
jgi:glycosyltransferase involved in cell wall biosynthesis